MVFLIKLLLNGVYQKIFQVEKNDVDTHRRCAVGYLTRHLEQHTDTAGAIVGTKNRRMPVGGIGIVVGKRARIPMCAQQDPPLRIGIKLSDDVFQGFCLAGINIHFTLLHSDLRAKTLQRICQEVGTCGVWCSFGDARSEIDLRLHKCVGRIGIESRHNHGGCLFFIATHTIASRQTGDQQHGKRQIGNAPHSSKSKAMLCAATACMCFLTMLQW